MLRRWLFAAVAACVWPLATALAAPTVLELRPSSRWNMRYQDGSCELMRQFGEGDDQIIVQFTRMEPSNSFALRLLGKPFINDGPYQDVRVGFGETPAVEPLKNRLSGMAGSFAFADLGSFTFAGPVRDIRSAQTAWTPEQEATVTKLTVGPHRGKVFHLQLGSMRAPMQAMRTCTDDLVRSWGYDPAVIASLLRPVAPIGNPGSWVHSSDYPSYLLRQGKLGVVRFRIDVDEAGKVTNCAILRRTGEEAFATMTCEMLMHRSQFLAALDRDGRPVKSFWISGINWLIPQ